jgi:WD40 repeat protein
MGGFYGSVQVRSDDRPAVLAAVKLLSRGGQKFLVGPELNGWIGIYPEGSGQDLSIGAQLAPKLRCEIVAMLVHDDDIFAYEYCLNGRVVDQFNSRPDYFGDVSDEEMESLRGKPESLAHLSPHPDRYEKFCRRLASGELAAKIFASDLLVEFADCLGIQNALTSYEYLHENEETEDVECWDQFIHVPDLTREREKKHATEAGFRSEKLRLFREGHMLAETEPPNNSTHLLPHFFPAPDGDGFLVAWSPHFDQSEKPVLFERYGSPWPESPTQTPLTIKAGIYAVQRSGSGRHLAAVHSSGNGGVSVWDLSQNELFAEFPQLRGSATVGFLPDDSAVLTVSPHVGGGQVTVTPLDGSPPNSLPFAHAQFAVAHPSATAIVVSDAQHRLIVADFSSGTIVKTHFVGGKHVPSALEKQATAKMREAVASIDVNALEKQMRDQLAAILARLENADTRRGQLSQQQIDEFKKQYEKQIQGLRGHSAEAGSQPVPEFPDRGSEQVFRLKFDPSGEHLFVATAAGLRVFRWSELIDKADHVCQPAFAVNLANGFMYIPDESGRPPGYTYDIDFDPDRNRVVFAGLDGHVRYLDLETGASGVLLAPPALLPITHLALSGDRSALLLMLRPEMNSRRRKTDGPVIQFWDYHAISRS